MKTSIFLRPSPQTVTAARLLLLMFFLTPPFGDVWGQARTQRRIGTAEEFLSPAFGELALNSVAGITDRGKVLGSTLYFLDDDWESGYTAIGWTWDPDTSFTYTLPSPATSPILSALNPVPYPYDNANQHGLWFYSSTPDGEILAFASDNRFETPGLLGFYNRNPSSSSQSLRWKDGGIAWLPYVNHPASATDGMEYVLEQYSHTGIWPGGHIQGWARRVRCKTVDYSADPVYWNWQAVEVGKHRHFLLPRGGVHRYFAAPAGWPEDMQGQSIASVNREGHGVGVVSRPGTNANTIEWIGVYWDEPENPRPLSEIIGTNAVPVHITAAGDIVGVIPANATPTSIYELWQGRLFLWLPRPAWGLPAGLNWLTDAGTRAQFTGMNERGLLLYQVIPETGLPVDYQWSSGVLRRWSSLFTSATWTNIVPSGALNDKGWVVCWGTRLDNGKTDIVLSLPLLDFDLTVEPKEVQVDDEFELVATVRSATQYVVTDFAPTSLPDIVGKTNAIVVSGPVPGTPQTLPSGGTLTFKWRCRATHRGEARFAVQIQGNANNTIYRTLKTTSDPVSIVQRADLWIKHAKDPAVAFAGNDLYLPNPDGRQIRFATSGLRDTNRFQIRLQNDARTPESYVLRFTAPDAQDWQVSVRDGNSNLLSAVFAPAGWQTPELAPGAVMDLTLEVRDVAADEGDQVTVTAHVANADDAKALDAVVAVVAVAAVPIETSLHRTTAAGYTTASIAAGQANADAPLELVTSKAVLAQQPLIFGGWVADGVTPMLLELSTSAQALEPFPNGREFRLNVEIEEGGSVAGVSLPNRLRLLSGGGWAATNRFKLAPGTLAVFAAFTPMAADELKLSADDELVLKLTVEDVLSGKPAGQTSLRLRKPPVVLIHGYNTPGGWGPAFIQQLTKSRPPDTDAYPWIRIARYGQGTESGKTAYVTQLVNTLWPLVDLVPLAEQAFEEQVAPLREQWAFTRFDAVCHSQGGLLTRMLCSQTPSRTLPRPFRNELNYYRGRFHRVVTIGSPHNGTRLLRYLLALNETEFSKLKNNLPVLIGHLGVLSEVAQDKFDPFGVQIRDLNNPSPDSRWVPDPAAQFHLLRSTINRGQAPWPTNLSPAYGVLGLTHPVGGPAVVPRGSDGVVDFDSMGDHAPDQPAGANVFTLPPGVMVSHAGPPWAFNSSAGQTDSPEVAAHVIAALDQDPALPAADRVFSSFVPAQLLEDSIRQQIDDWAAVTTFKFIVSAINPDQGSPQHGPRDGGPATTLRYTLTPPPDLPVTNTVSWFVEAFTTNGVNAEAAVLTVDAADSRRVTVEVPAGLLGDVVLYASYLTTNGATVLVQPRRIYSTEPANATLVGIEVEPNEVSLPVGSEVPIELWARYSDGSVIQRHVLSEEITAASANTNVVVTTNATVWRLVQPGTATVRVNYQGVSATNQLTAYAPIPPDAPSLRVTPSAPGLLSIAWSPTTPGVALQETWSLSPANWTNSPSGTNNPAIVPATSATRFYRLFRTTN